MPMLTDILGKRTVPRLRIPGLGTSTPTRHTGDTLSGAFGGITPPAVAGGPQTGGQTDFWTLMLPLIAAGVGAALGGKRGALAGGVAALQGIATEKTTRLGRILEEEGRQQSQKERMDLLSTKRTQAETEGLEAQTKSAREAREKRQADLEFMLKTGELPAGSDITPKVAERAQKRFEDEILSQKSKTDLELNAIRARIAASEASKASSEASRKRAEREPAEEKTRNHIISQDPITKQWHYYYYNPQTRQHDLKGPTSPPPRGESRRDWGLPEPEPNPLNVTRPPVPTVSPAPVLTPPPKAAPTEVAPDTSGLYSAANRAVKEGRINPDTGRPFASVEEAQAYLLKASRNRGR